MDLDEVAIDAVPVSGADELDVAVRLVVAVAVKGRWRFGAVVFPSAVAKLATVGPAVSTVLDSRFAHSGALTEHETVGL
jgi:hypothetical protein